MAAVIEKLEWQSEGHRMWYTHKNPYGCWICELLQVARQCQSELVDDRPDIPDDDQIRPESDERDLD